MKYSEAEGQIKKLSNKYDVEMNGKDFCIVYDGKLRIAYVDGINKYGLHANYGVFLNMPANDELFMILAHLAKTPLDKRVEEKKYHIRIFDGLLGYLNIDTTANKMRVYDVYETYDSYGNCLIKTKFTDKDIEELKRRDDIPLDWKKVKLEEVE